MVNLCPLKRRFFPMVRSFTLSFFYTNQEISHFPKIAKKDHCNIRMIWRSYVRVVHWIEKHYSTVDARKPNQRKPWKKKTWFVPCLWRAGFPLWVPTCPHGILEKFGNAISASSWIGKDLVRGGSQPSVMILYIIIYRIWFHTSIYI